MNWFLEQKGDYTRQPSADSRIQPRSSNDERNIGDSKVIVALKGKANTEHNEIQTLHNLGWTIKVKHLNHLSKIKAESKM